MKKRSSVRLQFSESQTGRRLAVEKAIALAKSAGRWQNHPEAREHQTPPQDDTKPSGEKRSR